MSISRRSASLLISKRVSCSKIRACAKVLQQRSISNDSNDLPTRYTLPTLDTLNPSPFTPKYPKTLEEAFSNPKCSSCGIELQQHDKEKPGFCKMPEYKTAIKHQKRTKEIEYYKAYSKLDEEGRKILEESMEELNRDLVRERKIQEKRDHKDQKGRFKQGLKCVRCYDALYHSKIDLQENRVSNYQDVMDKIPNEATLVHVASAYDFPLGLINHKKGRKTIYAINKADLLFSNFKAPTLFGTEYFGEMINRLTNSNTFEIVSANNQWNLPRLLAKLPAVSYLVGYVNSGKTFLANKLRNRAITNYDPSLPWEPAVGTSFIPALTRDNIEVDLIDKKTYDTPGFLPEKTTFDIVKPDYVRSAMKGIPLYAARMKEARYVSVHGGQCYTIGGLMYLCPPEGTLLQIVSASKGNPRVFRDLEKAKEVMYEQPDSITGISVKPEAVETLIRYIIPPFVGKIDLVIKDYGFVQITPIGKKNEDQGLFEVWAPEGVLLGVRSAIADFITKSTPVDKKGGIVHRGSGKEAKRFVQKPVPRDEKLFTRLYKVPVDCDDTLAEVKRQYSEHVEKEGSSWYHPNLEPRYETNKNQYWIEKIYDIE